MCKQFPFSEMSENAVAKYSKRVEALLATAITVVACDPVNDDVIYGFACGESGSYLGVESPTLHYVMVRHNFREHGIGTRLVRTIFPDGAPLIYTHITKAIHHANLKSKWNLVEFDPYYVEGALYSKARNLDAGAVLRPRQHTGGAVVGAGYRPA